MNSICTLNIPNKADFFPCFQPIVDISTTNIAGYESLARTRSTDGNVSSAGWLFSDPLIDNHTLLDIDRKVRNDALDYAAKHTDCGMIFINISPFLMRSLRPGEVPPSIKHLQEIDLDPSRVVFEITENVGNSKLLDQFVNIYRDAGVKIAIDDFGIGGSQVDRIVAYSPDYIKIDMGMFKGAARKGKASNVILSLADLADRSGCQIICEGIETEEEYHFAIECGASKVQGWLFDQAMEEHTSQEKYQANIQKYQDSYLVRKRSKIMESFDASEKLHLHLQELIASYELGTLTELDIPKLHEMGIIRLFECDFNGRQTSPNYKLTEQGLKVDEHSSGRNWAHRPYFSLLIALHQAVHDRQIVSSPYVDRSTRILCKTRGVILGTNRALFIDTATPEETLFCQD